VGRPYARHYRVYEVTRRFAADEIFSRVIDKLIEILIVHDW
jgi:hypothetical protein